MVVVKDKATVVINDKSFELSINESKIIQPYEKHMLENKETENLIIAEVPIVHYLQDDDTIRFSDFYNRI